MRALYSYDVCNIFEDNKAKGNIFPEKSSVQVQFDVDLSWRGILEVLTRYWKHWERHSAVANVRVENTFQTRLIAYLAGIHCQNSFFERHYKSEVQIRISC